MRILMVEDDDDDAIITRSYLEDIYRPACVVARATTLSEGLVHLYAQRFDVFLVDYRIGADDGLDFVRAARENGHTRTPIILLTGLDDRELDIAAMEAGVTDYLVKQYLTAAALERSIRYALKRKEAEALVEQRAFQDPLTGLPNRAVLLDRLRQSLARGRRRNLFGAVLFLDLDDFKRINDDLGHAAGDAVLREVASRLMATVRQEDTVARLGGDEFVILMPESGNDAVAAREGAQRLVRRIEGALAAPVDALGRCLQARASIGMATFPDDAADAEAILHHADQAMYRVKAAKHNRARRTRETIRTTFTSADLHRAHAQRQLRLFYQPEVDAESGTVVGAEALLRWQHSEHGLMDAGAFIAVAETSRSLAALFRWVLHEVVRQTAAWPAVPRVSFNVAVHQFSAPGFVDDVARALAMAGIAPKRLALEFSEEMILSAGDDARGRLEQLKSMGVTLVLDRFGRGLAPIACLARGHIDRLKIDGALTRQTPSDPATAAVVEAIVAAARAFGVEPVATGVETDVQSAELRRRRIRVMQGFLCGRPAAAAAFTSAYASGRGTSTAAERPSVRLSAVPASRTPAARTARA